MESEKLWYVFENSADGVANGADYVLMEMTENELMFLQNFFMTVEKYHKNYSGNIHLVNHSAIYDGFKTKQEAIDFIHNYCDAEWEDIV